GRWAGGRPQRIPLGRAHQVLVLEDSIEPQPLAMKIPEHAPCASVAEHALCLAADLLDGPQLVAGGGTQESIVWDALPQKERQAARHCVRLDRYDRARGSCCRRRLGPIK